MRIPAVTDIDSRDGSANKDERLTNALAEKDGQQIYACIRPGLNTVVAGSGAGKGMTCFNSSVISVLGTTLYSGETPISLGSVSGTFFDFAVMP